MKWKYLSLTTIIVIASFSMYLGYHPYSCELIDVYSDGLVHFEKTFRCKFTRGDEILTPDNFAHLETMDRGAKGVTSSGLEMLHKRREYYEQPVYENITVLEPCNTTDNTTCWQNVTRSVQTGTVTRYRMINSWESFLGEKFNPKPNTWYYFKHSVSKPAELGPVNIDVQTWLFGYQLPWTWWNSSFDYRSPYQFNNATSTELVNFPLLVSLNSSNLNLSRLQSACQDIRFIANDNATKYAYEIENCTVSMKYAKIWVNVTLPANDDFTMWIYYGSAGAVDDQDATSVWNSDFKFVTHMVDYDTSHVNDSTTNNQLCLKDAANTPTEVDTGIIAQAQDYNPNHDLILLSASSQLNWSERAPITIEFWVKPNVANAYQMPVFRGNSQGQATYTSYFVQLNNNGKITIGLYDYDTGTTFTTTNVVYSAGVWQHIVAIWDGTTDVSDNVRLYINNTFIQSWSKTDTLYGTDPNGCIGSMPGATYYNTLDGLLDEVRLMEDNQSSDWIRASYDCVREIGVNIGDEEEPPPSDTCTPPAANNDWVVNCNDNCSLSSDTDLGTGYLNLTGTEGNFTLAANLTFYGFNWSSSGTCTIAVTTQPGMIRSD